MSIRTIEVDRYVICMHGFINEIFGTLLEKRERDREKERERDRV